MKVYVARQPIFDLNKEVFAYELLYRNNKTNAYDLSVGGNKATKRLLSDVTTVFQLSNLTHGTYAFVNFTKELLLEAIPDVLDAKDIVIEILEDVIPDDALISCVKHLKELGFQIALDDYCGPGPIDLLLPYADIIKVDFILAPKEVRIELAKRLKKQIPNAKLLAEKIETLEEYEEAKASGYSLFQGYYFSKPMLFSKSSFDVSNTTGMRLLNEVNKQIPDYTAMAQIVRNDIGMTYSILKEMNTIKNYRGNRIKNVKDALVRMGVSGVRKWVLLKLMRSFSDADSDEIIRTALVRAVFSEKLASEIGLDSLKEQAFTAGMFSMMDSDGNEDMFELLSGVSIFDEVKDALMGDDNEVKRILMFVQLFESGQWEKLREAIGVAVDQERISGLYIEAVQYADSVFSSI